MASTDHKDDGCGFCCWIVATILYGGFFLLLTYLPRMGPPVDRFGKPTTCSVELVGFEGLQLPTAPGATSPVFDFILHMDNGHIIYLNHGGGDVVVSYAGVPLAQWRTPSFQMAPEEVAALPVKVTGAGVGVPKDLFLLMTEERKWGVAQLRIEFDLAWDSFTCDVDLDGQPRVSECDIAYLTVN